MDESPRYWVYICASNAQADWADWLTKALMRYRVPKHIVGQASRDGSVPKRLTPIFRHRQETPASADLNDDIRQALAQSRYLIAVCSPEAAVSRWVNEEIRYFKALGRQDRVLCLIVDGEPNVSEQSNSGLLECFPRAVRYRLDASGQLSDTRTEPIAADARADRDGKQNAKLKLLAGVLGIGFDQLRQRERQRTMRARMRNAVLAGIVLILLGSIWAWQQQQQNELARQSRIAKLTEQGRVALIDGRFDLALTHIKQAQALGGDSPSQRFLHHQATAFAENARTGVNTLVLQLGGHEDQINTIAMSVDGARILTASTDARTLLWDAASGNLQAALVGHRGPLGIAQFSHRAKRVATAAAPADFGKESDTRIQLWDDNGKHLLSLTGHSAGISALAFSPDDMRIVSADVSGVFRVWDTASGNLLYEVATAREPDLPTRFSKRINAISFSPDGEFILSAADDRTARLWRADTGASVRTFAGHDYEVVTAEFVNNGASILTNSKDGTVRIWDTVSGAVLQTIPAWGATSYAKIGISDAGDEVFVFNYRGLGYRWDMRLPGWIDSFDVGNTGVVFADYLPNSKRIIVVTYDGLIHYWDTFTFGVPPRPIEVNSNGNLAAAMSSDGKYIALAHHDLTGSIWDLSSRQKIVDLHAHQDELLAAAYRADGKKLATASHDGTAKIWDTAAVRCYVTLQGHQGSVNAIAFSPDGNLIVTGGTDGTARIWDAVSGVQRHLLDGHQEALIGASFNAAGTLIVTTATDRSTKIWDAQTGVLRADFPGSSNGYYPSVFSPDGTLVATASPDKTVKLWDIRSQSLVRALTGPKADISAIAFSDTGARLIAGERAPLATVWDTTSGQMLAELSGHTGDVLMVDFSQDGSKALTGSADTTAKVWDVDSGQILLSLEAHDGPVSYAEFSPDGHFIVTAGDNTAKIWDRHSGRLLSSFGNYATSVYTGFFSGSGGREVRKLLIHKAAYRADGKQVYIIGTESSAYLWDVSLTRDNSSE